MEEIARSLPITEGLERMMTILKRVGYKTAILSGGFTYFGNYLRQKYGFDYVYANELRSRTDASRDAMSARWSTDAARLNCCGCCASSRRSTSPSRWPSATRQRPADAQPRGPGHRLPRQTKVKATARQSISTIGLDGILYFLGLKDSRIEQ